MDSFKNIQSREHANCFVRERSVWMPLLGENEAHCSTMTTPTMPCGLPASNG